jgi:C1A family cysteine protease
MPRRNARYGWIPDLPDQRDHLYAAPPPVLRKLPPSVDLRPKCPPVFDQGRLGSCTANALAAAYLFDLRRQKASRRFIPSRLFIYYNERVIEGTTASDSGAQLRDGIKSITKLGVCNEPLWPYETLRYAKKPPPEAYHDALDHQALEYQRVAQEGFQMKGCLATGFPFVFGFMVYETFEAPAVARTGRVPMPAPGEVPVGGHAVMAVGYDDKRQAYLCQNSWSTAWGEQGFFWMPYAYLGDAQLVRDLWTIRSVEG